MRLQLSIRRHDLPTTNIIFTTGSGPSSKTTSQSSTITDLLLDVSDLVPLESADGEWGLEDYVVEVQATADQQIFYECLHFQIIDSVLREDDEVIIRSLGSDDLRSRRLGGRHQITVDGRHLIDGVVFGRKWLQMGGRPGINIPPRKRRRLEIEPDDGNMEEEDAMKLFINARLDQHEQGLLLRATKHPRLREAMATTTAGKVSRSRLENSQRYVGDSRVAAGEEDDDDDDDDNDDEDDEDDDDDAWSTEGEDEYDQPLRIKETAEFGNADSDVSEEILSEQESDDDFDSEAELALSDELKALLEEAEALSKHADVDDEPVLNAGTGPRSGKRKRSAEDEGHSVDETDFEGFSIPTKSPDRGDVNVEETSSDSDSDSDSDPVASIASSPASEDSDLSSPSLDTSDRDSDSNSDSINSTSSSDSDSDSDADSSGSDSSAESIDKKNSETAQHPALLHKTEKPNTNRESPPTTSLPFSPPKHSGTPGQGTKRTKNNNRRVKRKKRLNQLKREGILPAFATLADLDMHDRSNELTQEHDDPMLTLQEKKETLLQQLQISEPQDHQLLEKVSAEVQVEPVTSMSGGGDYKENTGVAESGVDIVAEATATITAEQMPEPAQKRARLDLASSRRMVFSSLGLKNPKTPAAEQELRDKLAKSMRMTNKTSAEKTSDPLHSATAREEDPNAWKDRIELSAVECDYDGVELETPPFPFHQGWDQNANKRHGKNKKKARNDLQYHDKQADGQSEEVLDDQYAPDVSMQHDQQHSDEAKADQPGFRSPSPEAEKAYNMLRSADFQVLSSLTERDLAPGMFIAYKELDMENMQPVISAYRVGRVTHVWADDGAPGLEILLSKTDRRRPARKTYDENTGRRTFTRFEAPDEDDEVDDGIRTMGFQDLIDPKIVLLSNVQVPASGLQGSPKASHSEIALEAKQDSSVVVPDSEKAEHQASANAQAQESSVTQEVEVTTPRRNEITAIIKEAGFDSAIDEQLQPPVENHETLTEQSSPAFNTRSHRSQMSSHSPPYSTMTGRTTSFNRSGFDSPQANGWDSSSVMPRAQDDSNLEGPNQDWQTTQSSSTPKTAQSQPRIAYPRLSQLDIDESQLSVANSSSHQDAQRTSQAVDLDISNLPFEAHSDVGRGESSQEQAGRGALESMDSEMAQSQDDLPSSPAAVNQSSLSSFLGHGLDGHTFLGDDESDDHDYSGSESLPSLRRMTSSQPPRVNASSSSAGVSPPPRGKVLRNGKKRVLSSASPVREDVEALPSTKKSQTRQAPLSQARHVAPVIDLTLQSDPVEREGSDGEYTAARSRITRRKRSGKLSQSQSQSQDLSSASSSAGIGKRKFLTNRKTKSYI